jgi:CubicO group peptidase (beta-lactamase class C family)
MRTARSVLALLVVVVAAAHHASAQSLPVSLFQRYVESLRTQAGIPGLSAVIVQNGTVVWERGFGFQDVEASIVATPDTVYPILDLSQTLASTVLLRQCLDGSHLELSDRVRRWLSEYPDSQATVGQLLAHVTPSGAFSYDPSRFALLTGVFEQCAHERYPRALAEQILDRLAMVDSVPGRDLASGDSPNRRLFPADRLDQYARVLARMAVPYRVDARGRASRSSYPPATFNAATGVVSSVRDLARFDRALADDILLDPATRNLAWSPSGSTPTGLGWFVSSYSGPQGPERVVWHFGVAQDASSSLIVKVPGRNLTLILLANSDGLSARNALSTGDLTASIFATTFLKLFIG